MHVSKRIEIVFSKVDAVGFSIQPPCMIVSFIFHHKVVMQDTKTLVEEVRLFTAAERKNGLKMDDRRTNRNYAHPLMTNRLIASLAS